MTMNWRVTAWSAAALMLLLPLFAMQVTDAVDWDGTDFAIFGAMLLGVGLVSELAVRKSGNGAYRFAVGIALAAAFLLIGVTGAVGIIGSEGNGANLMYGGVLAFGLCGAVLARFRAPGMARAMFATALAQALVAAVALIAGFGTTGASWPLDILVATTFFVALWLLSAWLFRNAAWEQSAAGPDSGG